MARIKGLTISTEKTAIDTANCTQNCTLRIVARISTPGGKRIKLASGIIIGQGWWRNDANGEGAVIVTGNRSPEHNARLQASKDFQAWKARIIAVLNLVPRDAQAIRQAMAVASTMRAEDLASATPTTFAKQISEYEAARAATKSISQYLEEYAEHGTSTRDKTMRKGLSESTRKAVQAVAKSWARFEAATKAVNIADLNAQTIQAYITYIANEKPVNGRGRGRNGLRSNNSIASMAGTLRTAIKQIAKRINITLPEDTFAQVQREKYPVEAKPYLSGEEIATLCRHRAATDMDEAVRRAFIFQSSTGVRFSDLAAFTPANINDGALVYQSAKTSTTTTVPLNSTAMDALGDDWQRRGRLFAVPSLPTYNAVIKRLLMDAGITRQVVNYNGTTSTLQPIYEIASSHMARRTFVGRLVEAGVPAEIIQGMSGHKKGSKAFARYYNITDKQKADAVAKI